MNDKTLLKTLRERINSNDCYSNCSIETIVKCGQMRLGGEFKDANNKVIQIRLGNGIEFNLNGMIEFTEKRYLDEDTYVQKLIKIHDDCFNLSAKENNNDLDESLENNPTYQLLDDQQKMEVIHELENENHIEIDTQKKISNSTKVILFYQLTVNEATGSIHFEITPEFIIYNHPFFRRRYQDPETNEVSLYYPSVRHTAGACQHTWDHVTYNLIPCNYNFVLVGKFINRKTKVTEKYVYRRYYFVINETDRTINREVYVSQTRIINNVGESSYHWEINNFIDLKKK